jgi:hypothetical protein
MILDILESLFKGLSNPTNNKPKDQQVQVLCIFSHVSTRCSISLSTWDLSNYSCCIPLHSTTYLYSRWKGYVYLIESLSLHMPYLLNISSIEVAILFVSFFEQTTLNLWLEPFQQMRVPIMDSSHFHLWFNNNLILHAIWILIVWLVPRLNASTFFFTTVVLHRRTSPLLPFTFAQSFEALFLLSHPIKTSLSHIRSWTNIKHSFGVQ